MQMFTMNNVKETRTLRIPLLFLKCRNPFLTGMRKPKHGSVYCCTLCIKHEKHPQLELIYFPCSGCAFSNEKCNQSLQG